MSFLAPILCVFEQIITFALHFRDVGCIIKLAGPTGGCLIACSHSFHFTLALQQLDNQSLWKHPVYPPGPMLNACVQRWLLGDSHVYRWRTFRLAGWWARVSRYFSYTRLASYSRLASYTRLSSYSRFYSYTRHSSYSRFSSYTRYSRLSRHPSYLDTLGLLVHRWGAAIFSPFHPFTFKGAAIFSPFHPFTLSPLKAQPSFHLFTFSPLKSFSPLNVSFSYKNVSWTIIASIWTIIASPLRAFVVNLPPQKMGRKRTRIDINQFVERHQPMQRRAIPHL